jgi:CheY-like chemotaxis protein
VTTLSPDPLILFVEDHDATAYLLQRAVSAADGSIDVVRVANGQSGLDFLNRTEGFENASTPDLVLMDLRLPKKNGFEVLAAIRASALLGDLPVIIFSASVAPEDRARARALGATLFFQKPTDLDGFAELARWLAVLILQYRTGRKEL